MPTVMTVLDREVDGTGDLSGLAVDGGCGWVNLTHLAEVGLNGVAGSDGSSSWRVRSITTMEASPAARGPTSNNT